MFTSILSGGSGIDCTQGYDFSGNVDQYFEAVDIGGDANLTISQSNGNLLMKYDANPGGPNSSVKYMYNAVLEGELDVQVDWDLDQWADSGLTTYYMGLGMRRLDDNNWRLEATIIGYNTTYYRIPVVNGSSAGKTTSVATSQTSGKFKLIRDENDLWATQYWNGSSWSYWGGFGTALGDGPVEVYLRLVQAQNNWPECGCYFDNFIINSADVITCT